MTKLFAASLMILVAIAVDVMSAQKFHIGNGTVLQKIYSPPARGESRSANTVYGQASTAERMIMVVSFGSEEASHSCGHAAWDRYSVGDSCRVFEVQGMFFNYGRWIQ